MSAYAIICDAMRDAGLLPLGDVPAPEQLAENLRRLRELILLWQTQGLKLFLQSDTAVPLQAGVASYTFAPGGDVDISRPFRVLQGYYLFSSTNVRRPLSVLSWDEYLRLGSAGTLSANRGAINSYFVEKLASSLRVTFWPCPDSTDAANGQAHVLLQTQATQISNLTDESQFPAEWDIALHWGLADEICTGQPMEIMQRCAAKAATYRMALEDWDVEDAPTSFAPDQRSAYATGGFR